MTQLEPTERAALCDLLEQVGGRQPTLCEGWLTSDLAAHLVLREGRPDAAPGIFVPGWARWTARVQRSIADGDFARLVERLRAGPPRWSPIRLPRVHEAINGVEFFVHHEDVRRAQPGWQPRDLGRDVEDAVWKRTLQLSRFALRRKKTRTVLVRTDTGERHVVVAGQEGGTEVTMSGRPSELLLYLNGRREHALVIREPDAPVPD